jgi:hypothetical protein
MDHLLGIGKKAGRVWYSAVDSIHCNRKAYDALDKAGFVGEEIGQLRLKTTALAACYRGVGDYTLDRDVTRSGLPLNAKPACQYCRVALPEDKYRCPNCHQPWNKSTYSYHLEEGMDEVIGQGPKNSILDRELAIDLPSQYRLSKIRKDGWTEPFAAGFENDKELPVGKYGPGLL